MDSYIAPLCLLGPQVLLLDEITVDLDVVGRLQLLEFFRAGASQWLASNTNLPAAGLCLQPKNWFSQGEAEPTKV